MNAIIGAIKLGGFVATPRDYITTKLGLDKTNTAWEFIRSKYAKHFGFGLEVRGSSPDFESTTTIRHRAIEAVDLALEHYGDMLIEADVQVKEGSLGTKDNMMTGYDIDFSLDWNYSKPVLIEITYDRPKRSYRIMSLVYNHVIDGVPLALYTHLIHNHLVLGNTSFLSQSKRTFSAPYKFHLWDRETLPDKKGWLRLNCLGGSDLFPTGSQIDVTDSNILKLRNKIAQEIGQNVSTSSVEIALMSLEMGITWATDYIAQGDHNSKRQIDVQKGYRGLGIVRTHLGDDIRNADSLTQYRWIRDAVKDASDEMDLERTGNGRNSRFYSQYRKISRFFVDLFDRRISHHDVMAVAGTQLLCSNLNGIDYGVPLCVGGIIPDDMKFIFIPSHGEHNDETKVERAKRSLTTHVTEVSFACGPKIKDSNDRSVVYKSLKVLPQKADHILLDWGHAPDKIKSLSQAQRVKQVFIDAYRPDNPRLGRIEKRAELYLCL